MQKILSMVHVQAHFSEVIDQARENLGLSDPQFWQLREECRMLDGTYTPFGIAGDDHMSFLHMALDGTGRVAYTKSAEKGADDIQTVTTLDTYCEKFGLHEPEQHAPESILGQKVANYFAYMDLVKQLKAEIRQLVGY